MTFDLFADYVAFIYIFDLYLFSKHLIRCVITQHVTYLPNLSLILLWRMLEITNSVSNCFHFIKFHSFSSINTHYSTIRFRNNSFFQINIILFSSFNKDSFPFLAIICPLNSKRNLHLNAETRSFEIKC